jgi:hypothetical protein
MIAEDPKLDRIQLSTADLLEIRHIFLFFPRIRSAALLTAEEFQRHPVLA